jgi:hypothetical protein
MGYSGTILFPGHHTGKNDSLLIDNKSFGNVVELKYLGKNSIKNCMWLIKNAKCIFLPQNKVFQKQL